MAATLTTALGKAYIEVLVALYEKTGGETPSLDDVKEAFSRRLLDTSP